MPIDEPDRAPRATGPTLPDEDRLRMLARIVDQVADGVAVVDNDGRFVLVNPAFAHMHGCPDEDLVGESYTVFYDAQQQAGSVQQVIADALRDGVGRAEVVRIRRDGTPFPAQVTLSLLRGDDGELVGRVLSVQDITERTHLEAELRRQALHDPLTGLPNRRLLLDRLGHALARARGRGRLVAVLFVDLDGFKAVNDVSGHAAGDAVLAAGAQRLAGCLRPGDTLARLGGDEFVVVVDDVDPAVPDAATRLGDRLRAAVADRPADDVPVRVTASVGVALAADGPAEDVLASADRAMYQAKAAGKDRVAGPDVVQGTQGAGAGGERRTACHADGDDAEGGW